jgi:hypothetical protein
MRELIIRSAVAFVTFSMGLSLAGVFTARIPHDSNQPAEQLYASYVETKPREVKTAATDTTVTQPADLYIDVGVGDSHYPSLRRESIKLAERGATVIELDLAESIDSQKVTLNFRDDNKYRILQRYRTSMSVSVEGPHLDLLDWRHFDSPWISLKAVSSKRFRTLATKQMESTRFPATTNEEIVADVRKRVGADWPDALEFAKSCDGPNSGACFVAISSIYLRIQKRVRAGWDDVGLVEFRFPMGC